MLQWVEACGNRFDAEPVQEPENMTEQSPPPPRNKWLEIAIIAGLMVFGGFYLASKVKREEPVQFTEQNMTPDASDAFVSAKEKLQNGTERDMEMARIILPNAVSRHPDYPPGHGMLGLNYAVLSKMKGTSVLANWDIAEREADLVLADYPFQIHALLAKAWVEFYRDNDAEQASITAQKALKQDKFNPYGLTLMAEIEASHGKFKLAARYADTLALLDPKPLWQKLPACTYHSQAEQWRSAITACQRVLRAFPNNEQARDLLANAEKKAAQSSY
jgi:tetratricopeptide (TPR) repeat protein